MVNSSTIIEAVNSKLAKINSLQANTVELLTTSSSNDDICSRISQWWPEATSITNNYTSTTLGSKHKDGAGSATFQVTLSKDYNKSYLTLAGGSGGTSGCTQYIKVNGASYSGELRDFKKGDVLYVYFQFGENTEDNQSSCWMERSLIFKQLTSITASYNTTIPIS